MCIRDRLASQLRADGVGSLYEGAAGATLATVLGHYPWFLTNNFLEKRAPPAERPRAKLVRRAGIGFCSSFASDCVSNGMRVVKTYKQTSLVPLTYVECVRAIVAADGVGGLFWRGLLAKIVCNGVQSILFSILWKMMMDRMNTPRPEEKNGAKAL